MGLAPALPQAVPPGGSARLAPRLPLPEAPPQRGGASRQLAGPHGRSGLDVTLRLEGEREDLAAPVVEAAYHVVQEGLTNALRYAAGAAVRVLVCGEMDAFRVEVEDAPASEVALAGSATGTGVQGLRKRVGACGGRLEAGLTADGAWRLAARLLRRIAAAHPSG
jgi:signal transduction histidine kinase